MVIGRMTIWYADKNMFRLPAAGYVKNGLLKMLPHRSIEDLRPACEIGDGPQNL